MPPSRHEPLRDGEAVVVVVDDWPGTFTVPDDAALRLDPGPRWLVPAGGVLGLVLTLALAWSEVPSSAVWLLGAPLFVACVAAIALDLGGPRGTTAAVAGTTAVWQPMAAAVLAQAQVDARLTLVLLLVGTGGQVLFAERTRVRLAAQRSTVRTARGGTRTDGWVVAAAGPPWDTVVRVEGADTDAGPWTATHAAWRLVRPRVGHPVSIWHAGAGDAVVLLPRVPR
ncbi:hypothetical protein [Cellulomonas sp. URHB0016]